MNKFNFTNKCAAMGTTGFRSHSIQEYTRGLFDNERELAAGAWDAVPSALARETNDEVFSVLPE